MCITQFSTRHDLHAIVDGVAALRAWEFLVNIYLIHFSQMLYNVGGGRGQTQMYSWDARKKNEQKFLRQVTKHTDKVQFLP